MAKKRAIIGFKGVALAPVTENSITAYVTGEANSIQYAGSMTRTPKEAQQEFYYDDDLYTQIKDVTGDEVEVRFAEIPLATLAQLGLGVYDEATGTLEADFNVTGKTYAFRCVTNTMDGLPMYFNWRVFDLAGIRFDNFASKGSSLSVCEVIMSGVFKRPALSSVKPYAIRQPKEDGSDLAACDAWIKAAETLPKK